MLSTYRLPITALTFLFLLLAFVESYYEFSDLGPGPFCASNYNRRRCCVGREDECSVPLLSTLCYCDDFCNRTQGDCCPDYLSHCKGIEPTYPPATIKQCYWKGQYMLHGQITQVNCNKCTCSSLGERAEVLCEENACLIDQDLIDKINLQSNTLGWQASNHSDFWGHTLDEGIQLRLGTLNPSRSVYRMHPVRRIYDPASLPRDFDARNRWSREISRVRDQGWCGSSWAVSTAAVASDRFAVMSKGRETVELSAQNLLSCNNRGQQGCKGGYLDRAWLYIRKHGVVDEQCYPWMGKNDRCKIRKRKTLADAGCRPSSNPRRVELYRVGPAYRLGNETDIMHEIMTSGPVQATMVVYHDFFNYKSGIYQHSTISERDRTGYHSVRIIGWGEEQSYRGLVKYWIVANSWGQDWGEEGTFRILRGSDECKIESFVLATWAKSV